MQKANLPKWPCLKSEKQKKNLLLSKRSKRLKIWPRNLKLPLLVIRIMFHHITTKRSPLKPNMFILKAHHEEIHLLGPQLLSPYHVLSDEDDDYPFTKRHFKDLNAKLDKLLASTSSSSSSAYADAAIKALIETSIQQPDECIKQATMAVLASSFSCKNASDNVAKIIEDAQTFHDSLKVATESNANKVNSAIDSLSKSLQGEQKKFEMVHDSLKAYQTTFLSSISSRLEKLQDDLALENKLRDELALSTSQSNVGVVHSILLHLFDAHDLVLTITTRRHLAEKLRLALDILSRIEGESSEPENPKLKHNNQELTEKLKKADQDIERENKEKEVNDALERRKSLFPLWTIESLLKEAIESSSTQYLTLSNEKITTVKVD
ncbi:unnamed protein product [Lactuca saligna]|uniref:Uncharacterized protein n=1 Tax=Lactuca saligna TaxID=75948 RepID=A0AA35Y665_LACSI|nr:unnamed protein product [Lactuca saligna]